MRLEAKPLECSACGEVIEGDPYESEGDPFCTRECSDAFDVRVYLLYNRWQKSFNEWQELSKELGRGKA